MGAIIWPLLIYWFAMFISCYMIVEFGQDFFYDEVTPRAGLKVGLGSFLLAALLTWLRPSFDTMFTSDLPWTVLQAIVWFAVFTLIFQFHPTHAAGIGIVALLLIPGVATMGVESIMTPTRTLASGRSLQRAPAVRRSLAPSSAPPANPAAAAKK
ncbi:hypothetical protein SAMN05444166_6170 [Singulisphaera sp. GP187]|uniref:hypothetical protein n=1 Tax=Singulisphaera sp. GP187 TaxID=1882752 RepID=UPI0009272BC9|nr:hypothetical protein [Singulisphaera sp. GP187]SIO59789.1 hypothetical protein SAMN05444166_6170 [Singulisphaera sp. GP187]